MADSIQERILEEVADLHGVPAGAYNIRANGQTAGRNTTANIDIVTKTDKPGIDIRIKPGTRNESVHIPVVVSASGLKEMVYNDFFIGEDSDVVIVAGCGIHNCGDQASEHDGIHRFFVGKLSLIHIAKDILVGQIEDVIEQRGGKVLESYKLFDVYEGAQVLAGHKSVAYSITFRAKDHTLEEKEVTAVMNKILNGLKGLGIELRA